MLLLLSLLLLLLLLLLLCCVVVVIVVVIVIVVVVVVVVCKCFIVFGKAPVDEDAFCGCFCYIKKIRERETIMMYFCS